MPAGAPQRFARRQNTPITSAGKIVAAATENTGVTSSRIAAGGVIPMALMDQEDLDVAELRRRDEDHHQGDRKGRLRKQCPEQQHALLATL